MPEALAAKVKGEDLAKDEGFKGFLAKLHAVGASQKQVDVAVSELLERGVQLREGMPLLDAAECESTLRQDEAWKSDEQYAGHVRSAFTAAKSIFGKDFDGVLKDYGNDPRFIRGMAAIGKEMGEDQQASPEAQAAASATLDQLMNSAAYTNPSDPQHTATVARVDALTKQVAGTRPVGSGKTISFKT